MYLRKLLLNLFIAIFTITILVYGLYKAQNLILGPNIIVSFPSDSAIFIGTTTAVRGVVSRANQLFINGVPTAFTDTGFFETRLVIFPPNTILQVEVVDKFGRRNSKTLNISSSLK